MFHFGILLFFQNLLHYLYNYFWFYLRSKGAHGIHSPFIFELYTKVIACKKHYHFWEELAFVRGNFLKNEQTINIMDYGAGSKLLKGKKGNRRKIKHIVKYSVSSPKKSQLLFKLIDWFKPAIALELGTSLGINTLYMASASRNTHLFSLEACPRHVEIARNLVYSYSFNIEIILGKIECTLPVLLNKLSILDFIFFDANHTYQSTFQYFKWCVEKINPESIMVIDDIYWSEEMKKVWKEIQKHPKVHLTIDLFDIGLVFFRKKQEKEHFLLRY